MISHADIVAHHFVLDRLRSIVVNQRFGGGTHQDSVAPGRTSWIHVVVRQVWLLFERIRGRECDWELVQDLLQWVQFSIEFPEPRLFELFLVFGVRKLLLAHYQHHIPDRITILDCLQRCVTQLLIITIIATLIIVAVVVRYLMNRQVLSQFLNK